MTPSLCRISEDWCLSIIRPNIAVVLITFSLTPICWGQNVQQQNVLAECTKMIRVHSSFPKGPFGTFAIESYKRPPILKYKIKENGTVTDATVTRSSGVAEIDKNPIDAIRHWQYKPRPAGCGYIETQMLVLIHWAAP